MLYLLVFVVLLCCCKAFRSAVGVFIVVFTLLCLTHDWSKDAAKDNGQTPPARVQSGKAR